MRYGSLVGVLLRTGRRHTPRFFRHVCYRANSCHGNRVIRVPCFQIATETLGNSNEDSGEPKQEEN